MSTREPATLATRVRGQGGRVVLVHGFTQTADCWGPFGDALARRCEVVAVDAPGHGGSVQVHADVVRAAELLGDTGGRAAYIGYSMGGRIALRLAVDRPELVRALVLISATPGIVDDVDRAVRRAADDRLAARLEEIGVEAFVDEWLRGPLFVTLPAAGACRDERLCNSVEGLASSLRSAGTGAMEPLWSRLDELRMPVLLVTGALDTKFTAIAHEMRELLPSAESIVVPDAGHTVHLEKPEIAQVVLDWLAAGR